MAGPPRATGFGPSLIFRILRAAAVRTARRRFRPFPAAPGAAGALDSQAAKLKMPDQARFPLLKRAFSLPKKPFGQPGGRGVSPPATAPSSLRQILKDVRARRLQGTGFPSGKLDLRRKIARPRHTCCRARLKCERAAALSRSPWDFSTVWARFPLLKRAFSLLKSLLDKPVDGGVSPPPPPPPVSVKS